MENKVLGNAPVFKRNARYSISFKNNEKNNAFTFRKRTSRIRKKSLILKTEVQPYTMIFKNEPNTLKLIESIKTLKEIKTKTLQKELEGEENNPKYLVKNIVKFLKLNRGLYNFFAFNRILDDKILYKLAYIINFEQQEKNYYIWEENDNSEKIYYLLKGKLSFIKNVGTTLEKVKLTLTENNIFGMQDILYERKRKFSCLCLAECCYLCFDKDFFKKYMEEKVNKVEAEKKSFLIKFFNRYITIPLIKLERFISNNIDILFFGKNELIYKEGDKNKCLYLIFNGEANLIKNIKKGEFFILPKFNQSIERTQEKAKNIDYVKIIKNENNNNNEANDALKNIKYIKNVDFALNKADYQVICTLSKGSIGGLEITTGTNKFKYNLVSNTDFCSVIRINLEYLDDEHLKMLMINLLPAFIRFEKKVHHQIKAIKYIDNHIVPPSCRQYNDMSNLINSHNNTFENKSIDTENNNNKSSINSLNTSYNLNISINEDENDKSYQKKIQKIDDKFDKNEGGFIKMNSFNRQLCNQKYFLKEQLKDSKRREIKIYNFIKKYKNDRINDLKSSTFKMNYLLSDENIKSKKNNFFSLILSKNKSKNKYKKTHSKTIKIWKFQSPRAKKRYMGMSTTLFMNLKRKNKKNKNKKIQSSKITKKEYHKRLNEIFDEYYKKKFIRKDYSKKEENEESHKLVSLKLLREDNDSEHKFKNIKLFKEKENDFIKEIIFMKGKQYKEESTNTYNLNEDDIDKVNSLYYNNDKKCVTQFNSIEEFNRNQRNGEDDKRSEKVIKIVNNRYIGDLFYKNSQYEIFKKNGLKNYNNKFRKAKKHLFSDIKNKNFIGGIQKNRMIFYDTGRFDMPLASALSKKAF